MGEKLRPKFNKQREKLFKKRYALRSEEGNLLEQKPKQMWRRLSSTIGHSKKEVENYYEALEDFLFTPAGRQLAGIGSGMTSTFFNCYFIPFRKDPEKGRDSREAIMETLKMCTEIQARGGGIGLNFSTLRPKGATVQKVRGESSGTVSWMVAYDSVFQQIEQGGQRRGASIFILEDWHPDILNFIEAKSDNEDKLNMANISVGISEDFMEAVKNDEMWQLKFPDTSFPNYDEEWNGEIEEWEEKGYPVDVYEEIPARKIWDKIATNAHKSAEPGIVWLERANDRSNTKYFETIRGTNPCVIGDTLVDTPNGSKKAEEVENGDVINTVTGEEEVDQVEHHSNQPVYKVYFSDGGSLKVTLGHQFHKIEDGNFQPTKLRSLRVGDKIRVNGQDTENVKIKKIENLNRKEDVYDIFCSESDTWITEGYVNRGCSELPLPPYGVCNLGAVNLVEILDKDKEIDWEELKFAIRQGVKFLDTVIDHNNFVLDKTKEQQEKIRRVGLGTMGLADMMLVKGVKYSSKKSLELIDNIFSFIRDEAYRKSAELAEERGQAPAYYEEQFMDRPFVQTLSEDVKEKIKENGIRNLTLLTQAPTGSTSILAGVSSGIEPNFAWEYERSDGMGTRTVKHWLKEKIKDEGQFVTAKDLDPMEHVKVQGKVQEYIDNSISKTINAPKEHTVEGVKETFMEAYDQGCKGVTYFREGSREGVLEEKEKDEDNEQTCPECEAKLVEEEGCLKCPSCGWSKCDHSDQLAV